MLKEKNINKILVFRALELGDMLCIIPAIRALKNQFPEAKITLAGLPWAKAFTDRFNHYFDDFICFPGFPGLPEQQFYPKAFADFLIDVQSSEFDLVLQMQGNGKLVNPLIELFGAKHISGFYTEGHYFNDNDLFISYPDEGHEIERHLKLMRHLGCHAIDTALEFPFSDQDEEDFLTLQSSGLPKNYVCIHPGSRGKWRQWPSKYFAGLANNCLEKGLNIVLTGTNNELDIINNVYKLIKKKPFIAAGKTSLGSMALLIKHSKMLISNCTGVSHIAAALKKRSIVINMDGEPKRWAPLNKKIHHTFDWTKNQDFNAVESQLKEMLNVLETSKEKEVL